MAAGKPANIGIEMAIVTGDLVATCLHVVGVRYFFTGYPT
ncbi:protein of unknown function [Moritella yayanosii]|uniref:Uncharacterized protein n=1 Tax=Moritella yayanosii TaxID=69539 RepID=A0A330LRM0_9GAMM|nr:protein of unknown function [Moritella yayanosii]